MGNKGGSHRGKENKGEKLPERTQETGEGRRVTYPLS